MGKIIGLTGSIGAGKSTVSEAFRIRGALVVDCDKLVHELYEDEAIEAVAKEFPNCIIDGKINRQQLGNEVFSKPERKLALEAIIHPLVRRKVKEFIEAHPNELILLEIQLLFETGADKIPEYGIDKTVVVDAPREQRKERVVKSRPHMTPEKFEKYDQSQMPIAEKKERADYIIDNYNGADISSQIDQVMRSVRTNGGRKEK